MTPRVTKTIVENTLLKYVPKLLTYMVTACIPAESIISFSEYLPFSSLIE